jgi:hypothetical protein
VPKPLDTVGALIDRGARLIVVCQECGFIKDASLHRIAEAKGLDFDLTDRHPPCAVDGCGYWLGFYVQEGMAMRPLETPEGARVRQRMRHRWMFADGNAARRYALKKGA